MCVQGRIIYIYVDTAIATVFIHGQKRPNAKKARRLAPLAGREEVGGYENLPVILVENFASLTGSRTRAFRLLKSPAVDPPPKAA